MTALATQAIGYALGADPAAEIRLAIAPHLDDLRIGGADVMVGVWKPGERRTEGNIIIPEAVQDNLYVHQGNVGLILKLGPHAYKTERTKNWFGEDGPPKVGDWVLFNFKQGESTFIGKQLVRLIQDEYVLMVLPRPDLTL